jgi:hypothetical protein
MYTLLSSKIVHVKFNRIKGAELGWFECLSFKEEEVVRLNLLSLMQVALLGYFDSNPICGVIRTGPCAKFA